MTMMETLHWRESIRDRKPDPDSRQQLAEILDAGIRAYSSGTIQTYSI